MKKLLVSTALAAMAATAGALASVAPVTAAPPAEDRVVRVSHVPDAERGDNPAVAVVVEQEHVIREGSTEAAILDQQYGPDSARAAGPGRFVVSYGNRLFVAEAGEAPRFLANHAVRNYQVDGPAHDLVVYYEGSSEGHWLTVRRISDGGLVDRRPVPGGTFPLAFRKGEVWFARGDRVVTWKPGTDRVRPRGVPGSGAPHAIDVLAGGAVRHGDDGSIVYSLRDVAHPFSWQVPAGGIVLGWAPSSRYLAVGYAGNDVGELSRIEIRNERTGRLVRAYVAGVRNPFRPASFRWETGSALLVAIRTGSDRSALVRLRAGGSWERASKVIAGSFTGLYPVLTPSGISLDEL